VGPEVVASADSVDRGVSSAVDVIGQTGSQAFDSAVNAGEEAFDDVKTALESALEAGEAALLSAAGKAKVEELQPIIDQLVDVWPGVRSDMSEALGVLRAAAMGKSVTDEAERALESLAKNDDLSKVLGQFFAKSFISFGFEFGASATFGVGVEAALGVVAGLPNVTDIKGYGTVGGSVGASAGAEVDESLVLNFSAPEDSGGPFVDIIFSLEAEVGGTIVVSFNLPDFSLGGISIGLGEGEEVSVAVGGGYTYVF
jgi:hypothetical protein